MPEELTAFYNSLKNVYQEFWDKLRHDLLGKNRIYEIKVRNPRYFKFFGLVQGDFIHVREDLPLEEFTKTIIHEFLHIFRDSKMSICHEITEEEETIVETIAIDLFRNMPQKIARKIEDYYYSKEA